MGALSSIAFTVRESSVISEPLRPTIRMPGRRPARPAPLPATTSVTVFPMYLHPTRPSIFVMTRFLTPPFDPREGSSYVDIAAAVGIAARTL